MPDRTVYSTSSSYERPYHIESTDGCVSVKNSNGKAVSYESHFPELIKDPEREGFILLVNGCCDAHLHWKAFTLKGKRQFVHFPQGPVAQAMDVEEWSQRSETLLNIARDGIRCPWGIHFCICIGFGCVIGAAACLLCQDKIDLIRNGAKRLANEWTAEDLQRNGLEWHFVETIPSDGGECSSFDRAVIYVKQTRDNLKNEEKIQYNTIANIDTPLLPQRLQ